MDSVSVLHNLHASWLSLINVRQYLNHEIPRRIQITLNIIQSIIQITLNDTFSLTLTVWN